MGGIRFDGIQGGIVLGNKIIKFIISIFIFVISFCGLSWGSFNFFIWTLFPDFLYRFGGGGERDHGDAVLTSLSLSLIFSLYLVYIFNKLNKKWFFILYVLFFMIIFILYIYIFRNRWHLMQFPF